MIKKKSLQIIARNKQQSPCIVVASKTERRKCGKCKNYLHHKILK